MPEKIDLHDRLLLQIIREEAATAAESTPNPRWVDAYEALMNAADRLDAMHARCEVVPCNCGDVEHITVVGIDT